jgi:PAS domain S-box-containing protein
VPGRLRRGISQEPTAQSRGLFGKKSFTRLLLVEDNPGDARMLSEMLSEPGAHNIELIHRETMSEAEDQLALGAVDVVLLDLGLPDVQGLAAVRRVHLAAPGVPLLVLTGLYDESLATRALQEGAQDYLVKGQIDARGLVRAVRFAIERKHMEEALRQSESRYRSLSECSPLAIFVIRKDKVVFANPACMKLFGASSPEDLLGKSVLELLHLGSQALVRGHIGEHGETVPHVELRIVRLDGTSVDVGVTASPLPDLGLNAIQVVLGDISERKRSESQLLQVEARYRGLLEAAPDAMVVVNGAGGIVLLNLQAEKQFGYHRDELVGQQVKNIIPEGFAERLIADDLRSAADALAQQIGTGIELVGRRKDGTQFPIEIMLSPLEVADGILVTAAIRDISVRKLSESRLLQMEKLESIGRLAGGIAHDFNNMLFVIHGYTELLTEDLASRNRASLDPDSVLLGVNEISHAAERAARLTAQLLAFSHQQVISLRALDLNTAIGGLEPMVRQLIGENMRLIVKLDPEAGRICGDPGQLDQILVNLVVNARDAMPDGGTVTIETTNVLVDEPYAIAHFDVRPGPYVLLSVTDTGMGMDRVTREHIFEPFFTTKAAGSGTGLGLATTYGIVRQAGGHIWVYSEPGVGSSFKLFFPRVDAATMADLPAIPVASACGTGTILVVEDERLVRDITTLLLTRSGYEVIAVADGAGAMVRLANHDEPIDALVTDVIMPNMSGTELAEWTMDRYPHVGVVLLSGYTAETLNIARITARGATFVPKPVNSGQLLVAVQQARYAASRAEIGDQSPGMPVSP